jgi:hypothetical protein
MAKNLFPSFKEHDWNIWNAPSRTRGKDDRAFKGSAIYCEKRKLGSQKSTVDGVFNIR